ncbi:telomere repeats-binding bouquet formation protein 1-like [Tachyglossus aculeatus]|uniref:telomere repeats-binding bouquet formation protein 1-like n=1 Tax=Tachyglossus aculeatus TaxID=9261 RepID=UPI0018F6D9A0|nr:telomere repeats-binding bouquet formation protein 1-like [Tachyglossus aculeatus]
MGLTCADINVGLLLEFIKQELNNIPAVKSALLVIVSICQEHSSASVYFQDIGGLKVVHKLARSDASSSLKEIALQAMGSLANCNVLCQQSLCTPEFFDEMMTVIADEDSGVNLQMESVSVLLSLVSKNRTGQMLLREVGCIPILLKLFRETLTKSEIEPSNGSFKEKCSLWHAVCKTLGAAVSNPVNVENQKICGSTLQHIQTLLEAPMNQEIICPLCLFIGLTLQDNPLVQKFFISVGGLDNLADIFTKLARESPRNISSAKMAVAVTVAMGVCIADNPPGGRILAKHHVVPKLLILLLLEGLNSEEKNGVLLTLGHAVVSCEQNLILLIQNNGLSLIADSLSESHNEVKNLIIFIVLHNCEILVKNLAVRLLENASQEILGLCEQGEDFGRIQTIQNTLPDETIEREEDEEQGPEIDDIIGDSVLKDSDQEEALPNQCSVLSAQICHPSANAPEDINRVQEPPKEE